MKQILQTLVKIYVMAQQQPEDLQVGIFPVKNVFAMSAHSVTLISAVEMLTVKVWVLTSHLKWLMSAYALVDRVGTSSLSLARCLLAHQMLDPQGLSFLTINVNAWMIFTGTKMLNNVKLSVTKNLQLKPVQVIHNAVCVETLLFGVTRKRNVYWIVETSSYQQVNQSLIRFANVCSTATGTLKILVVIFLVIEYLFRLASLILRLVRVSVRTITTGTKLKIFVKELVKSMHTQLAK